METQLAKDQTESSQYNMIIIDQRPLKLGRLSNDIVIDQPLEIHKKGSHKRFESKVEGKSDKKQELLKNLRRIHTKQLSLAQSDMDPVESINSRALTPLGGGDNQQFNYDSN